MTGGRRRRLADGFFSRSFKIMERDLTTGGVGGQLARFAAPFFISNILQSAYGLVDMAVVGRFVGGAALAAMASATFLCYLITSLCMGIAIGGGVLASQFRGARDESGLRDASASLLAVSAVASFALTAAGLAVYRPALDLMGLPRESAGYACAYMRVCLFGTIFVFGYNAACSILRGLGDSASPLAYLAIAVSLNAALDILFVGPLGMGTAGTAWATVISQAAACAIAIGRMLGRRSRAGEPVFSLRGGRPRAAHCKTILRLGIPSGIQSTALNLSYLLIASMLNSYGVEVAAAAGLGLKINGFAVLPCWAVGQAVAATAGQNMGAGKMSRAGAAAEAGVVLGIAATAVFVVLIQAFLDPLLSVFTNDAGIARGSAIYLRICCSVNCLAYAAMFVLDSFATGVGDSLFAMANSLLHSVAVRLALSWLLGSALGFGYLGIYWAEMVSPLPSLMLGIAYFVSGRWRSKRLVGPEA
jgi:putative MATE family efflux protein